MSEETVTEWPLAGRDAELDRIGSAVDGGRGVLLVGSPGVGKSRLLRAVLLRAAERGAEVGRLSGAGRSAAEMSAVLADRYGHVPWGDPEPPDDGSFPVARFVLGLDDAHLLAPAPAARLRGLVMDGHVTLVAAAEAGARTADGITRVWVERLVERVEIGPFDRSALAEILHARLGGPVGASTLEHLWEFTLGNALFLTELVDSALADSSLRPEGGVWKWAVGEWRPNGRLADLVRLRLGNLAADERTLVEMIALAEPLDAGLPAVAELTRAAEALNRRGIVVAERSGPRLRLRLANPLYARVLASDLPELVGARLRSRLADALESSGPECDDDWLRMVELRIDAGQLPDKEYLTAAARAALRRLDFVLAERLCLLAPRSESVALDLLRGHALAGQHRYAEAEAVFAAVCGRGTPAPALPPAEFALAVRTRAVNMAWGLHRVQDAGAVLDAAVAVTGQEPLQGTRVVLRLLEDRLQEAAAMGEAAPTAPLDGSAVPPAALARTELGDPVGALILLNRAGPGPEHARLTHQLVSTWAVIRGGDTAKASAMLDTLPDHDAVDDPLDAVRLAMVRAHWYRISGRLPEALVLLRQASAAENSCDWLTTRAWRLGQLAGALAEVGEHAEALRVLVELGAEQAGMVPYPLASDGVALEQALVAAHVGDLSGALQQSLELAERAAAAGRRFQALAALHLAARLGEARAVTERVSALARHTNSRLTELQAEHVRHLAAADGDALYALAMHCAATGLYPLAAEMQAQSARAHQTAGRHRRSRVARAKCLELLEVFDGVLPGWAALDGPEAGPLTALTNREREVAVLAASLLPNQEIAARLVVSVRTVENHLHRVFGKLGVTARAELAHRLDPRSASKDSPSRREAFAQGRRQSAFRTPTRS
ncbi:LuxR C-terminal-related transcriptional regulator [Streptomyces shenzhenensis]|uniref:helix-turn-helix transcriptional regulator n=1 Tax=Streptomyces shenzhenensis TaxID=943815 RepID=UPI0038260010